MAPYEAVPAVLGNPDPALLRRALGVLSQYAPEAIALGQRFADAGHELALVGGPVRDAFLGKAGVDLDFATSERPEETERILAAWGQATWDMGREFGTISGVAPAAKIAAYKVCWTSADEDLRPTGCTTSDIVAAIDQSVEDGVDVLNFRSDQIRGSRQQKTKPGETERSSHARALVTALSTASASTALESTTATTHHVLATDSSSAHHASAVVRHTAGTAAHHVRHASKHAWHAHTTHHGHSSHHAGHAHASTHSSHHVWHAATHVHAATEATSAHVVVESHAGILLVRPASLIAHGAHAHAVLVVEVATASAVAATAVVEAATVVEVTPTAEVATDI